MRLGITKLRHRASTVRAQLKRPQHRPPRSRRANVHILRQRVQIAVHEQQRPRKCPTRGPVHLRFTARIVKSPPFRQSSVVARDASSGVGVPILRHRTTLSRAVAFRTARAPRKHLQRAPRHPSFAHRLDDADVIHEQPSTAPQRDLIFVSRVAFRRRLRRRRVVARVRRATRVVRRRLASRAHRVERARRRVSTRRANSSRRFDFDESRLSEMDSSPVPRDSALRARGKSGPHTTTRVARRRARARERKKSSRRVMHARPRRDALRATTDIEPLDTARAFDFKCVRNGRAGTTVSRATRRTDAKASRRRARRRYFNSIQSEMLEFLVNTRRSFVMSA